MRMALGFAKFNSLTLWFHIQWTTQLHIVAHKMVPTSAQQALNHITSKVNVGQHE